MTSRYDKNRTARRLDNERRLMGETLAQFHERENPTRTAPGAGLPRARCKETDDLFFQRPQLFDKKGGGK